MSPEASIITLVALGVLMILFLTWAIIKPNNDEEIPDSWKTPEEMDYLLTDESWFLNAERPMAAGFSDN